LTILRLTDSDCRRNGRQSSAKTWIGSEQDAPYRTFSLLNRIALNLLKQEQPLKRGVMGKGSKDAWDCPYLCKLLGFDMRRPWV
jgi:hypothetical protein